MALRAPIPTWVLAALAVACSGDPPPSMTTRSQQGNPAASLGGIPPGGPAPSTGGAPAPSTSGPPAATTASDPSSGGEGGSTAPPTSEAGEDGANEPEPLALCPDTNDGGVEEDAGPSDGPCLVAGDIRVQYRPADTNALDNQVKPHFNLVNDGTESVPLSGLTVRYWFRDETAPGSLVFWCDYAQIGCGSVQGAFRQVDRDEANRVLELSFSGGTLAPGSETGEIQARFNREGWTELDETDDHSFDAGATGFADAPRVTLHTAGGLIWGVEPL